MVNDGNLYWSCLRKKSVTEEFWITCKTEGVITTKFGEEKPSQLWYIRDWNQRLEYHQNSPVLSVFLCILTSFSSCRSSSSTCEVYGCWQLWAHISALPSERKELSPRSSWENPRRNFCPLLSQSLWPGGGIVISPAWVWSLLLGNYCGWGTLWLVPMSVRWWSAVSPKEGRDLYPIRKGA